MSNSNGWSLSARLISKHFGALGDKISEVIAGFDPETATEADRDSLASHLRDAATKLAEARASFAKEHDDVVKLQALIIGDEKAVAVLTARLEAGTITEAAVNLFCDELEANKERLKTESSEEAAAKEYLDEVQKIVGSISEQLTAFDAHRKEVLNKLSLANAQKDLRQMQLNRQEELSGLNNLKGSSTALGALAKKAQRVSNEAESLKIISEIQQKPLDQRAEIDAIRKSVSADAEPAETTIQRLQRLSKNNETVAV